MVLRTAEGRDNNMKIFGKSWATPAYILCMQLSVRGNQNEGFNRVRAMPTTVKNKRFSERPPSINGAQKHPKKTHCRKPSSV